MPSPDRVKELVNELCSVIANTAPEVQYMVFSSLADRIGTLPFPQLVWQHDEDDIFESTFECPHCFSEMAVPSLAEHANTVATGGRVDYDGEYVFHDGADLDDVEVVVLFCPDCGLPVSLPAGWGREWG